MNAITGSVLELIGNTPLAKLRRIVPQGSTEVLAKVESLNPGGSIKDRVALAMVLDAERNGLLHEGGTVVEPSAGNMGVSLAMVAAARGYSLHVVMPEGVPLERRRLITRYDAAIHLTPSNMGMVGATVAATRLLDRNPGYVRLDQFTHPANVEAHRSGTGREILEATGGHLDAFVTGVGSGGTLTGVGAALREANPNVLIAGVEPSTSLMLSKGTAGDHGIVGIGADFIPPILDRRIMDETVAVSTQEAIEMTLRLAREEGLLVGISSGANVLAAIKVAERLGDGKRVVTVLPDTGERYPHLRGETQEPR